MPRKRKPTKSQVLIADLELQIKNLRDANSLAHYHTAKAKTDADIAIAKVRDQVKLDQLKLVQQIASNWGQATDTIMRATASILGQPAF